MNNKYLPIGIDLFFCIILLPAMMMMLPVDKWLESNSLFVITLIVWLYAVYFCIKQISVPMALKDRKHLFIAIIVLLGTVFITWLITQYQMDFPFRDHRPRMDRFMRKAMNVSKIKQHQQATWFMYLVTVCFSIAVGLLTELYRQIMARQASEFEKKNAVVVGISKDSVSSHEKFAEKYDLPFILLSDPELLAIQAYGVWQEKKLYGKTSMGVVRTTFLIDEQGEIVKIMSKVKPDTNAADVLMLL